MTDLPIAKALLAQRWERGDDVPTGLINPNGPEALAIIEALYSVLKRVRDAVANTDDPFVAAWCRDADAAINLARGVK